MFSFFCKNFRSGRNIKKGFLALLLFFVIAATAVPVAVPVHAADNQNVSAAANGSGSYGPWLTDQQKAGVYGSAGFKETEPEGSNERTDPTTSHSIDEKIGEFIAGLATSLNNALKSAGLDITTVILGRVKSGVSVNRFSFELAKKNDYGVLGAKMYQILRGIVYVFVSIFFMFKLVQQSVTVSANKRSEFKEIIILTFLTFAALAMLPKIIDLLLYMRDVALKATASSLYSNQTEGISITDAYYEAYAGDGGEKTSMNALVYLASVCITFYFGFAYIGTAITQTIIFILLPIVVILNYKDRKILGETMKMFLGNALIPILDLVVLAIPLNMTSSSLYKIIGCFCVIPARGIIRTVLGFGGGGMGEALGLGGALAGLGVMKNIAKGAGRFAKDTADGIGSIRDKHKQRKEDKDKADMYDELSQAEEKAGGLKPLDDKFSGGRSDIGGMGEKGAESGSGSLSSESSASEKDGSSSSGAGKGSGSGSDDKSSEKTDDLHRIENGDVEKTQDNSNISSSESDGGTDGKNESGKLDSLSDSNSSEESHMDKSSSSTDISESESNINSIDERRQNLANLNASEEELASQQKQVAELQAENAKIDKQMESNDAKARADLREIDQNLAENEQAFANDEKDLPAYKKDKADLGMAKARVEREREASKAAGLSDKAANNKKIASLKQSMEQTKRNIGQMKQKESDFAAQDAAEGKMSTAKPLGSLAQFDAANAKQSAEDEKKAIVARHANLANFESPEVFKNLSNKDKAKFYRQRAKGSLVKDSLAFTAKTAAKAGAAAAVGTVAGGAAMMYGPAMTAGAAGLGMAAGYGAGGAMASGAGAVINAATPAATKIISVAPRAVTTGAAVATSRAVSGFQGVVNATRPSAQPVQPVQIQQVAAPSPVQVKVQQVAGAATTAAKTAANSSANFVNQNFVQPFNKAQAQSGTSNIRIQEVKVPFPSQEINGTYTGATGNKTYDNHVGRSKEMQESPTLKTKVTATAPAPNIQRIDLSKYKPSNHNRGKINYTGKAWSDQKNAMNEGKKANSPSPVNNAPKSSPADDVTKQSFRDGLEEKKKRTRERALKEHPELLNPEK